MAGIENYVHLNGLNEDAKRLPGGSLKGINDERIIQTLKGSAELIRVELE